MSVCVPLSCLVLTKARKGCSYSVTDMWVRGIKHGSSEIAASVLNHFCNPHLMTLLKYSLHMKLILLSVLPDDSFSIFTELCLF